MKRKRFGGSMIIYKITNKANGKIYIGQTSCKNPKDRWHDHLYELRNERKKNLHFQNAFKKYKEENFIFEEILSVLNKEDLGKYEQFFIKEYKTYIPDYGYNKTLGGEGFSPTEEIRKKISDSHKGKKHSEEHKNKISLANRKRKHTEETKRKIGDSHKGRKFTESHVENMRKVRKGKKMLQSTKDKISSATRGKNNPMYGKPGKKRYGKENPMYGKQPTTVKKVIDFSTNIIYNSAKEASSVFNIKYSTLLSYLIGHRNNKTNLRYI
jgi:hypothetical protein